MWAAPLHVGQVIVSGIKNSVFMPIPIDEIFIIIISRAKFSAKRHIPTQRQFPCANYHLSESDFLIIDFMRGGAII